MQQGTRPFRVARLRRRIRVMLGGGVGMLSGLGHVGVGLSLLFLRSPRVLRFPVADDRLRWADLDDARKERQARNGSTSLRRASAHDLRVKEVGSRKVGESRQGGAVVGAVQIRRNPGYGVRLPGLIRKNPAELPIIAGNRRISGPLVSNCVRARRLKRRSWGPRARRLGPWH